MASLGKNVKVPTQVKIMAALMYGNDRHLEKAIIRSEGAALNESEQKARSRGKKSADSESNK